MWISGGKLRSAAYLILPLLILFAASPARGPRPAVPARPAQSGEGALAGCVICVDPGHGGYDGGARARDSRVWEKEINLALALALRSSLENAGATVLLTRTDDRALAPPGQNRKRSDLSARLQTAARADLFLSIHMNEYRSRRESGPQVFYREESPQGRALALAVQSSLLSSLAPAKKRAALPGDYFVLRQDRPAVLIECGFLSNPDEERALLTDDYRQKVADAIRDGVVGYWVSGE